MLRALTWWTAGAVLVGGLAAGIACGSGSSNEKSPAATRPAATVASASPKAAASAAPTSATTSGATSATSPAGATTELALVASNLLFDKSELKAAPGSVKFTVDNKDAGVPHNLHVFKGADASGESAGMTDLTVGPAKETVTLNLAKGDYFFQCDAHPATMSGKLEVE